MNYKRRMAMLRLSIEGIIVISIVRILSLVLKYIFNIIIIFLAHKYGVDIKSKNFSVKH